MFFYRCFSSSRWRWIDQEKKRWPLRVQRIPINLQSSATQGQPGGGELVKKVPNSWHNSFCMQDIFCLVSRPRRMSYPNFWIDAHIWFFWTKRSHYLTGIWRSRQKCKLNFTNSESTDLYVCWLCPKQKGFISTKGQHLEKSATGVVCIESASQIRENLEQS